jgi:phosphotransacetylase
MGASVPCILTSRADTKESKFLSIALASSLSKENRSKND